MKHSPRLSRRALLLFGAAMLLTMAELGWWTWFNLRNTARERRDHLARIEEQVRLADGLRNVLVADGNQLGLPHAEAQSRAQSLLAPHFPALSFAHGDVSAANVDAAVDIERQFVAHVRMFVAEGVVFAVLLLCGGYLIVRSLSHELRTMRQTSNFVAAVTHELNSPLASLQLWVETLERRPPAGRELLAPLQMMRADIERLNNLVGNVLTAARLENAPPAERDDGAGAPSIDAVEHARAIVASLAPKASSFGLEVRLLGKLDGPLQVAIGPAPFALVLRNLLDNAINYSGEAKFVDVRLAAVDGNLELAVTDYGIGLAAAEQARIFRKFYRVGDEMVRQSQGTGLGLFLVRAVLTEHGGHVGVDSAGLGCGSTFRVTLPLAGGSGKPTPLV